MKRKYRLNKVLISVFCFLGLMVCSCQDDDICIEPVSPRLIIIFETATGALDTLDSLIVNRVNLNGSLTQVIKTAKTDSIGLFIPTTHTPVQYKFYRRTNGVADDLFVSYKTQQEFVSKACGLRDIYTNVSFSASNNLIKNIIPETDAITDENEAHLIITY